MMWVFVCVCTYSFFVFFVAASLFFDCVTSPRMNMLRVERLTKCVKWGVANFVFLNPCLFFLLAVGVGC